jgi:hypothetical protein
MNGASQQESHSSSDRLAHNYSLKTEMGNHEAVIDTLSEFQEAA